MRNNSITQAIPSPEKAIATLADDISTMKSDVAMLVRSGSRHLTDRASSGVKQVADQARERVMNTRESIADFASEKPFMTIALAAVGGVLLVGMIGRYLRS